MFVRLFRTAMMIVIVAILLVPATTQADTNGRISGTITNGTTNAALADATVTASRFDQMPSGNTVPESVDVTTTTAADGSYAFEGLDTADGLVYAISVTYEGVLYSSGMVQISTTPEQTADITVYETTADQAAITLASRGLLLNAVDKDSGAVTITDVFSFENTSNRTIVADEDGRTLRFSVPANSAEVGPRAGFDFGTPSLEGATVFATSPLRPGVANPASLNYTIPYTGSTFDIELVADYPTTEMRLLLPVDANGDGPAVAAESRQLLDNGIIPIGDSQYHVWSTGSLNAGDTIRLRFSNLPSASSSGRALSTVAPALIALLALAGAAAIAGLVISRRKLNEPRPVTVSPLIAETIDERREMLTAELRALEAAYASGEIDEATYAPSRRAILEDLRRISRAMRGIGDDE